jgi:hypothetical protein
MHKANAPSPFTHGGGELVVSGCHGGKLFPVLADLVPFPVLVDLVSKMEEYVATALIP